MLLESAFSLKAEPLEKIIDPYAAVVSGYPWDKPGNQHIACFMIPQDAPKTNKPTDYLRSLDEVEAAAKHRSDGWHVQVRRTAQRSAAVDESHRLIRALRVAEDADG